MNTIADGGLEKSCTSLYLVNSSLSIVSPTEGCTTYILGWACVFVKKKLRIRVVSRCFIVVKV